MSTDITTYENASSLGIPSRPAHVEYEGISASGPASPQLEIKVRARTYVQQSPDAQYTVTPERMTAKLYLGNDVQPGKLIGIGEAELPLDAWRPEFPRSLTIRVPLTRTALETIVDAMRDPYVSVTLDLTGAARYVHSKAEVRFQFGPSKLTIRLAQQDWISNVLEPLEWGQSFVVVIPAPQYFSAEQNKKLSQELSNAHKQFLVGNDPAVFYSSYNALQPYYSERDNLLARLFGVDDNKKGAYEDLLRAVNRLANAGRHVPSERKEQGAFAVDRLDAELIRALTTFTTTYFANRLASQQRP